MPVVPLPVLPARATVLIDANIFIYAAGGRIDAGSVKPGLPHPRSAVILAARSMRSGPKQAT